MKIVSKDKHILARSTNSKVQLSLEDIFNNQDPYAAIQSGKIMARAWAGKLEESEHIDYAQSFIIKIIDIYWNQIHKAQIKPHRLPFLFKKVNVKKLDKTVNSVCEAIGLAAAKLPVIECSYLLGTIYTSVLPETTRSAGGIFYTPPSLSNRLIDSAEKNGTDWSTAKIIDPACGGGAFLAPICLRILDKIKTKAPQEILEHIQSHLSGWEIDPFAGWLTQVFVEVALKDVISQTEYTLQPIVRICNSMEVDITKENSFNLVIGNPPYGKLKLTEQLKEKYQDSLYGHPNLYGIFTHLAVKLCAFDGIVAYLTPTSYLSGEYFKKLREYLRSNVSTIEIDFVSVRKGIFDDVLQETMLAIHRKDISKSTGVQVNQITTLPQNKIVIEEIGEFRLPITNTAPWILPRTPQQSAVVKVMQFMECRLSDWGYQVSTGPLVWNRHKKQLTDNAGRNTYPLIWAEAITADGKFILKAEKVNHKAYFRFKKDDEWLISKKTCILLQRTTAKEQDKRLIAAPLPESLRKKGVVIENHLNMIFSREKTPIVSPRVLSAFLNSVAVNQAFRTISGSVAISAYELESMPLPKPEQLNKIASLIYQNANQTLIEQECMHLYDVLL